MTRAFLALCPQHVPQTLIRPPTEAALEEVLETFDYPFVAKAPRSSMGQGVFLIRNRGDWLDYACRSSVLSVQEYLPIDRDLRVVYVGYRVVAAYWRKGAMGLARGGRADYEAIPEPALALVAAGLGIDHAGFDLASIGGHWYLLEFNVLSGNQALTGLGLMLGPSILDYRQRTAAVVEPGCTAPLLPRAG